MVYLQDKLGPTIFVHNPPGWAEEVDEPEGGLGLSLS